VGVDFKLANCDPLPMDLSSTESPTEIGDDDPEVLAGMSRLRLIREKENEIPEVNIQRNAHA